MFRHLLGLVPVDSVEAFRLDQFVDFSCGDTGKDFLHGDVRMNLIEWVAILMRIYLHLGMRWFLP